MFSWFRIKNRFYTLTILSFLLFSSYSVAVSAKSIGLVKISAEDDEVVVSILMPQFKNMGNVDFERKLNSEIKAKVMSFVEEIKQMAARDKKEGILRQPYLVDVNTEVVFENEEIISLVVYYYQFTGGAHGLTTFEVYNVDVRNCRLLRLEDILVSEAESIIKNEIIAQIRSREERFFEDAEDKVRRDSIFERSFLIKKEGLLIKYPSYEIAPYASGMPEFLIDWGKVERYLKLKTYPR